MQTAQGKMVKAKTHYYYNEFYYYFIYLFIIIIILLILLLIDIIDNTPLTLMSITTTSRQKPKMVRRTI